MVVVNANATGAICILRFNRFRAKLCYRTFYLHAVLEAKHQRLPIDTADFRAKQQLCVASWNNWPARRKSQRKIPIPPGWTVLPSLMFRAVGSFETSLPHPYFRARIEIHKSGRSSTA